MKKLLPLILVLFVTLVVSAGTPPQKNITIDDIVKWNRITESRISPDGAFVAVKLEPWVGTTIVKLYDNKGVEIFSADSSSAIQFSADSKYLLYKRGDTRKSNLHIYSLKDRSGRVENDIRNFYTSEDWANMIVLQKGDSSVVIGGLDGVNKQELGKGGIIKLAGKAKSIAFGFKNNVMLYKEGANTKTIYEGEKRIDRVVMSEDGNKVALVSDKKLLLWDGGSGVKELSGNVSDRREPNFSENGSKIYFGLLPPERVKDASIKKEDLPEVHVWHWQEKVQFTQQVINRRRDMDANFLAVCNIANGNVFQITNDNISSATQIDKGNSEYVVGVSNLNYQLESMWEGRSLNDIYLINTALGRSSMVAKGISASARVSPGLKYLYWYESPDSSWYTCSIPGSEIIKITSPKTLAVHSDTHDTPSYPSSYNLAGWTEGDGYILIYDKYDIWKVDPKGRETPVRLTLNGRETGVTYRYVTMESNEDGYIDLKGEKLLTGFNNKTKGTGYYTTSLDKPMSPTERYAGNFMAGGLVKAKNSDVFMFTRQTFEEFPNLHISQDLKFSKITKITDANPQQSSFVWGTAELISWISGDGVKLEGVVYKPADFDPSKKYPMIVSFYETNSSTLFSHRIPEAHRSTIDYHFYTGNGYIVFNPDIVYKEGYPGESAYSAIMTGISKVLDMGFVDVKRVGAQGHSWGGYQTAYLCTKTNLFAAIESGAPVVNMFSAYGGIRWGSGLNRSFQYEHQQSRIGATPWDHSWRYVENSPIFDMDKVTTPILIMHNDLDDAVPWYQGIEFFVALKRLQKPVWMLNYTGEVHWPQKMKNKIDFQKRMMQFFSHYLKDAPMPQWMAEPMSLLDLEVNPGYGLSK